MRFTRVCTGRLATRAWLQLINLYIYLCPHIYIYIYSATRIATRVAMEWFQVTCQPIFILFIFWYFYCIFRGRVSTFVFFFLSILFETYPLACRCRMRASRDKYGAASARLYIQTYICHAINMGQHLQDVCVCVCVCVCVYLYNRYMYICITYTYTYTYIHILVTPLKASYTIIVLLYMCPHT